MTSIITIRGIVLDIFYHGSVILTTDNRILKFTNDIIIKNNITGGINYTGSIFNNEIKDVKNLIKDSSNNNEISEWGLKNINNIRTILDENVIILEETSMNIIVNEQRYSYKYYLETGYEKREIYKLSNDNTLDISDTNNVIVYALNQNNEIHLLMAQDKNNNLIRYSGLSEYSKSIKKNDVNEFYRSNFKDLLIKEKKIENEPDDIKSIKKGLRLLLIDNTNLKLYSNLINTLKFDKQTIINNKIKAIFQNSNISNFKSVFKYNSIKISDNVELNFLTIGNSIYRIVGNLYLNTSVTFQLYDYSLKLFNNKFRSLSKQITNAVFVSKDSFIKSINEIPRQLNLVSDKTLDNTLILYGYEFFNQVIPLNIDVKTSLNLKLTLEKQVKEVNEKIKTTNKKEEVSKNSINKLTEKINILDNERILNENKKIKLLEEINVLNNNISLNTNERNSLLNTNKQLDEKTKSNTDLINQLLLKIKSIN